MQTLWWLVRSSIVPVVATGLLLWWSVGELARADQHLSVWSALMVFAALACSWAVPRAAIVALYGVFVLQLVRVDCRFDQEGWIAYGAILLATIVVAVRSGEEVRRRRLLALLPLGMLVGLFANVPALGPRVLSGDGFTQVGQVNGAIASGPFASSPLEIVVGSVIWAVGALALIAASWMVGSTFRARRIQWAAEAAAAQARAELSDSRYELRVAEERDRIAHDVHDITAHSLSVILAQADGAAAQSEDLTGRTALTTIAGSARSALTEVRTLLENLEHPTSVDSGYTLDDIYGLIESTRATGRGVGFERRGTPTPLPAGTSLAAYRIAQEALANAVRHGADSGIIRVSIDQQASGVALTVSSPLRSPSGEFEHAVPGRGLVGMQQRPRLVGGWLTSGPDPEVGAYVVTASLPAMRR